jgi:hypothetical protein
MAGTQVLSGLSSSRFIWTNFATSGGNYLVICNGADALRLYDGTSWSAPSITGVSSAALAYVFPFKSRLFFIEKNTTDAWYLPVDSIAGAANKLTVGAELRLGGTLVAGATLTHDGGSGPDDYCVFVSSEGEVVIYSGTDPNSASTWGLAGVFRIGRPIGARCLVKTGGDLAVLTQDGIVSLAGALALDRAAAQKSAFSANIRTAFADQYALTGTVSGWEVHLWPAGHLALVNVPLSAGTLAQQFVMNVLTGAWCRFRDINALTWANAADNLYFGTPDGFIMRFGASGSDNGADINATCVGAFAALGNPGAVKHAKSALVFARASGSFQLGVNVLADFKVGDAAVSSAAFNFQTGGPLWDAAVWDSANWAESGDTVVNQAWMGIAGSGHYLAPVVLTSANATAPSDVEFIAMNMLYETGAPLS